GMGGNGGAGNGGMGGSGGNGGSGGSGGSGACTDNNANCALWASQGECDTNPTYMLTECCLSCSLLPSETCASTPLDCGTDGVIIHDAGPSDNRANLVIVGDCYNQSELSTTFLQHIQSTLSYRFGPIGEPYGRYSKFVNICALKVPSVDSGCTTAPRNTAFQCWGSDTTRLGLCDNFAVYNGIQQRIPASLEVTWTSVVMNDSSWWGSGGVLAIWSGGHYDAKTLFLHEGGHAFHALADEYGGTNNCAGYSEPSEINVTRDPVNTSGKWDEWLGSNQSGATGPQSTFEGARYCDTDMWRPSFNSMMNQCFSSYEPTNSYNSISREKMIRDIYAEVRPIDCYAPGQLQLTGTPDLSVTVVDPNVITLDWLVDGVLVAGSPGATLHLANLGLSAGTHEIRAHAHDDTPWVRGDRSSLEQTITWTVQVP
ncbi:MAG TPA: M64 family metallopeptidase, partial [Polyangium sp.]|nr:M64 family metallopeptidase [Polyangium sp.]